MYKDIHYKYNQEVDRRKASEKDKKKADKCAGLQVCRIAIFNQLLIGICQSSKQLFKTWYPITIPTFFYLWNLSWITPDLNKNQHHLYPVTPPIYWSIWPICFIWPFFQIKLIWPFDPLWNHVTQIILLTYLLHWCNPPSFPFYLSGSSYPLWPNLPIWPFWSFGLF